MEFPEHVGDPHAQIHCNHRVNVVYVLRDLIGNLSENLSEDLSGDV